MKCRSGNSRPSCVISIGLLHDEATELLSYSAFSSGSDSDRDSGGSSIFDL